MSKNKNSKELLYQGDVVGRVELDDDGEVVRIEITDETLLEVMMDVKTDFSYGEEVVDE